MAGQKDHSNELDVEDVLTQSKTFLVKNKKTIIGATVAVIVIVAGVIPYKNFYIEPHEEKAQAALFKNKQYFEQDTYEQAPNGDSIGSIGFLKTADQFNGTETANLAKAYVGICYQDLGKYDGAIKILDGFSRDDQMVAPAIQGVIGNCHAQLGRLDEATSTLLRAADNTDNNTLSPIFLLQAGEVLMK